MTRDDQRLPETVAKQVLARAAQLDASDQMSVSIGDLRTAALEAGISVTALDEALRELAAPQAQSSGHLSAERQPAPRRRRRMVAVVAVVVALMGASLALLRERLVPSPTGPQEDIIIEIPRTR